MAYQYSAKHVFDFIILLLKVEKYYIDIQYNIWALHNIAKCSKKYFALEIEKEVAAKPH